MSDPDTASPAPASLRALLDRGVADRPAAVALSDERRSVTWAQLHERACRVAAALVRDGVRARDRVVYVGRNDVRFFEFLFGCALAGAVPTPVNWRLAPPELAAVVADSGAGVVLVDDTVASPTALGGAASVLLGPAYEEWLGPPTDPQVPTGHDDVALQLYTSGTTGRPKGAMFAGRNVQVLLGEIAGAWGLARDDVSLVALPLFHMGGLAWALTGLARGARLVLVRDFDPAGVLATMAREGVTAAFFVPTMLAALCAAPGARAGTTRRVFYSGAPIGVAALTTAMRTFDAEFVQLYGLTEATGAFAQLDAEDHDPGGPRAELLRSAGRPYPWVQVRVVEPGGNEDVAPGEVGEIWTRSAQNLVGYWRQPEETARALTEDGWLRTGDLGRLDGEGRIFLVDRVKDLVISGGENVYPVEVENVLAEHPALAEVAVIGVPDARWGETVKAVVVPVAGAEVDPAEVIAFTRARLAGFKCPTSVDVVASLPRTATGKVRKPDLRAPYWQDLQRQIH